MRTGTPDPVNTRETHFFRPERLSLLFFQVLPTEITVYRPRLYPLVAQKKQFPTETAKIAILAVCERIGLWSPRYSKRYETSRLAKSRRFLTFAVACFEDTRQGGEPGSSRATYRDGVHRFELVKDYGSLRL